MKMKKPQFKPSVWTPSGPSAASLAALQPGSPMTAINGVTRISDPPPPQLDAAQRILARLAVKIMIEGMSKNQ